MWVNPYFWETDHQPIFWDRDKLKVVNPYFWKTDPLPSLELGRKTKWVNPYFWEAVQLYLFWVWDKDKVVNLYFWKTNRLSPPHLKVSKSQQEHVVMSHNFHICLIKSNTPPMWIFSNWRLWKKLWAQTHRLKMFFTGLYSFLMARS